LLGACALVPVGQYGQEEPRCQCQAPAVQTPDGLDCIDPCEGVDCSPGDCAPSPDTGLALCTCPLGYAPEFEPPACLPVDAYHYELIYEDGGQEYPFGHGWVRFRETAEGAALESQSNHFIQISYEGGVGAAYRGSARLDATGALREASLDEQTTFGALSARRRMAYGLGLEGDQVRLRLALNVLGSLWRGERPWDRPAPLPFASAWDWPSWSYGCFDPLFYFLLGRTLDLGLAGERELDVLIVSYGLPTRLPVVVTPAEGGGPARVELPWFGATASYQAGLLQEVDYGWVRWRPAAQAAALELNLRPLPLTPLLHPDPPAEALAEEPVALEAGDGVTLSGSLALPEGAPLGPAVLLAPDLLPSNRDLGHYHTRLFRDLAAALARAGLASLRLDGRGVGESGGDALAPLARLEADLDAAHALLAGDARFDGVVLVAHAHATPLALEAARRLPLRGLVLIAPTGADLGEDLFHLTREVIARTGLTDLLPYYEADHQRHVQGLADGTDTQPAWGRSAAFWQALLARDPDDPGGIACPVLLLAGEEELALPPDHVDSLAAAFQAQGTPVEAHRLPGLGHRLTPGQAADLLEAYHLPWAADAAAAELLSTWIHALPAGGAP
ncbi:MAG TPA: alpha/beta hydrolase, partial [Myxococcota bacterium]|nr:alpha/beta hydrolase [Myxococcota bacterium]